MIQGYRSSSRKCVLCQFSQWLNPLFPLFHITVRLHNALVLSILYNTTRPTLPPLSVRHSGWHKRQRDKNGFAMQDRDPKRRRIKAAVMAIGKRERAELKMLNSAASAAVLASDKRKDAHGGASGKDMLSATFGSRGGKVGTDGLPVALIDAKSPSASELLPLLYFPSFPLRLPEFSSSYCRIRKLCNKITCAACKHHVAENRKFCQTSIL
jgi:hypothetical protein